MFVLTYRNANGSLRVGPKDYATEASAKGWARHYSVSVGRTVTVLDLTDVLAAYAPGGDRFNWRAEGWYCQHSYEFCTPCFAGYDHPADEYADYVANAITTAEANGVDLDATHGPWS